MPRSLSTHMFVSQRLGSSILDRMERSGFGLCEIFCARQHLDYRNQNQVQDVAGWFRDHEMRLHSLHLPMYRDEVWGKSGPQARVSITELEKTRRIEAVDELKRALEVLESIPAAYAVLHVGPSSDEYDPKKFDAAMWSIEQIRLFGRQRGVTLLLENTPSEMATPDRLLWLMAEMRFSDIGICFDAGHAHLGEGLAETWSKLSAHVKSTHLHDNGGEKDDHLFPFEGTIDWAAFAPRLREAGESVPWLLEIHDPSGQADPVNHSRGVFDRLEELARESGG